MDRSEVQNVTIPRFGSIYPLLRGLSPLAGGLAVSWFLIQTAEAQYDSIFPVDSVLDANTWAIASNAWAKDAKLFAILIAGNFITIFLSLFLYQNDITTIVGAYRQAIGKKSHVSFVPTICNYVSQLALIVWLLVFVLLVVHKTNGHDLSDLLIYSTYASLVVFTLFSVEDGTLWYLSKFTANNHRTELQCQTVQSDSDARIKKAHQLNESLATVDMARDSVLFIDLPTILSAVAILLYSNWISNAHSLNGFSDAGIQTFLPSIDWASKQPPSVQHPTYALSVLMSLGFSAGGHLMQLFISQVIFTVLNIRLHFSVHNRDLIRQQ